ncbi:MAG TPA: hypothetical protein VF636_04445, partial [Sphingomonas sp.]
MYVGGSRFAAGDQVALGGAGLTSAGNANVARLANGGFVAAWSYGFDSSAIQIFDADGAPSGPIRELSGSKGQPDVSILAGGGFVLSWSARADGDVSGIKAQTFDDAGEAVSPVIAVDVVTAGNQSQSEVVGLANGGFAVAWTDYGTFAQPSTVKARLFDAAGQALGGEIQVTNPSGPDDFRPEITATNTGFVVSWGSGVASSGSIGAIGAQTFDLAGNRQGSEIRQEVINGVTPFGSSLAVLKSGVVVLTWTDRIDDVPVISGRMFTAQGVASGSKFQIAGSPASGADFASVAALDSGEFVVAWHAGIARGSDTARGTSIEGRLFDASGLPLGGVFTVGESVGPAQTSPDVRAYGSNDFAIGWTQTDGSRNVVQVRPFLSAREETVMNGTTGDDTLRGTMGDDRISALAGNDLVFGSAGGDVVDGGAGFDRLQFVLSDAAAFSPTTGPRSFTIANGSITGAGGLLATSFVNIESVRLDLRGSDFGDVVDGSGQAQTSPPTSFEFQLGGGDDRVTGTAGNDSIVGGRGRLTADGGAGNDLALFAADAAAGEVTIRRAGDRIVATQNGSEIASLRQIERIQADAADRASTAGLRVDAAGLDVAVFMPDTAGIDTLVGGAMADIFFSVTASDAVGQADRYTGGGGADVFDFRRAAKAMDGTVITDFDADDRVRLDSSGFPVDGFNLPIGSFIVRGAFTGEAGEIRYRSTASATFVEIDGDGDRVADATLTLNGGPFALGFLGDPTGPYIAVRPGVVAINGTENADTITGGAGDDEIAGLGGGDQLDGGAGRDELYGDAGDDRLNGGDGEDLLDGGAGDDVLTGGAGFDRIDGGDGNDVIDGGAGSDFIAGGDGDDRIVDVADPGMFGQATIDGGGGSDVIEASGGVFSLIGGGYFDDDDSVVDGDDRLTLTNGGAGSSLDGGDGADVLRATGTGSVSLYGEDGDDDIAYAGFSFAGVYGGAGRDLIRLASGDVFLGTGDGADVVLITTGARNVSVFDFAAGEAGDRIDLSVFGADPFGPGGPLAIRQVESSTLITGPNGLNISFFDTL